MEKRGSIILVAVLVASVVISLSHDDSTGYTTFQKASNYQPGRDRISPSTVAPLQPFITFKHTYGGTNNDEAYEIIQTPGGGFVMAGRSSSFPFSGCLLQADCYDAYLVKVDKFGSLLWERVNQEIHEQTIYSMQRTYDGDYILGGYSRPSGTKYHPYALQVDGQGNKIWSKDFPQSNNAYARSIEQISDAAYLLGGVEFTTPSKGIVIKINNFGVEQWTQTYTEIEDIYKTRQTPDGDFILIGQFNSGPTTKNDAVLAKIDSSGNLLWSIIYDGDGGATIEQGFDVQVTSDGGYVFVGYSGDRLYVVKTNNQGAIEFENYYGNPTPNAFDIGTSIWQTSDGGYAIAGYTAGVLPVDGFLMKLSSTGDLQFERTYNNPLSDEFHSVQQTNDGGFILAGRSLVTASNYDFYAVKTDKSGNL
jgi:hypothetical protein